MGTLTDSIAIGLPPLMVWLMPSGRKLGRCGQGFPWGAALVSGMVFAAVHLHAATFLPLWFLGVAFAWLYWTSGTIRSSMLCHFLFNVINLSLCLFIGMEA